MKMVSQQGTVENLEMRANEAEELRGRSRRRKRGALRQKDAAVFPTYRTLMVDREQWIDFSEKSTCMSCSRGFHALRFKHHCRGCGEVVCGKCSSYRKLLDDDSDDEDEAIQARSPLASRDNSQQAGNVLLKLTEESPKANKETKENQNEEFASFYSLSSSLFDPTIVRICNRCVKSYQDTLPACAETNSADKSRGDSKNEDALRKHDSLTSKVSTEESEPEECEEMMEPQRSTSPLEEQVDRLTCPLESTLNSASRRRGASVSEELFFIKSQVEVQKKIARLRQKEQHKRQRALSLLSDLSQGIGEEGENSLDQDEEDDCSSSSSFDSLHHIEQIEKILALIGRGGIVYSPTISPCALSTSAETEDATAPISMLNSEELNNSLQAELEQELVDINLLGPHERQILESLCGSLLLSSGAPSFIPHSPSPTKNEDQNTGVSSRSSIHEMASDKLQKRLERVEKQLRQAGIKIVEDIPYMEAKGKVEMISQRLLVIGDELTSLEKSDKEDDEMEKKRQRETEDGCGEAVSVPETSVEDEELRKGQKRERQRRRSELQKESFTLEQEMEKYHTALTLSDEYAMEIRQKEERWEREQEEENLSALCFVRRCIPVNVRALSEQELMDMEIPSVSCNKQRLAAELVKDKSTTKIPRKLAIKLKRTNVLEILRMHPETIRKLHPSIIEAFRITGLCLLERRALHAVLRPIAEQYWGNASNSGGGDGRGGGGAAGGDPLVLRKWSWYEKLRDGLKNGLANYAKHIQEYGEPPNDHHCPYCINPHDGKTSQRRGNSQKCQVQIEAEWLEIYESSADLAGFPSDAVYELELTAKAEDFEAGAKGGEPGRVRGKDEGSEQQEIEKERMKAELAEERAIILRAHYTSLNSPKTPKEGLTTPKKERVNVVGSIAQAIGAMAQMDDAIGSLANREQQWAVLTASQKTEKEISSWLTSPEQQKGFPLLFLGQNVLSQAESLLSDELKPLLHMISRRASLHLSGKRDKSKDGEDTRSLMEIELAEMLLDWVDNTFGGMSRAMQIKLDGNLHRGEGRNGLSHSPSTASLYSFSSSTSTTSLSSCASTSTLSHPTRNNSLYQPSHHGCHPVSLFCAERECRCSISSSYSSTSSASSCFLSENGSYWSCRSSLRSSVGSARLIPCEEEKEEGEDEVRHMTSACQQNESETEEEFACEEEEEENSEEVKAFARKLLKCIESFLQLLRVVRERNHSTRDKLLAVKSTLLSTGEERSNARSQPLRMDWAERLRIAMTEQIERDTEIGTEAGRIKRLRHRARKSTTCIPDSVAANQNAGTLPKMQNENGGTGKQADNELRRRPSEMLLALKAARNSIKSASPSHGEGLHQSTYASQSCNRSNTTLKCGEGQEVTVKDNTPTAVPADIASFHPKAEMENHHIDAVKTDNVEAATAFQTVNTASFFAHRRVSCEGLEIRSAKPVIKPPPPSSQNQTPAGQQHNFKPSKVLMMISAIEKKKDEQKPAAGSGRPIVRRHSMMPSVTPPCSQPTKPLFNIAAPAGLFSVPSTSTSAAPASSLSIVQRRCSNSPPPLSTSTVLPLDPTPPHPSPQALRSQSPLAPTTNSVLAALRQKATARKSSFATECGFGRLSASSSSSASSASPESKQTRSKFSDPPKDSFAGSFQQSITLVHNLDQERLSTTSCGTLKLCNSESNRNSKLMNENEISLFELKVTLSPTKPEVSSSISQCQSRSPCSDSSVANNEQISPSPAMLALKALQQRRQRQQRESEQMKTKQRTGQAATPSRNFGPATSIPSAGLVLYTDTASVIPVTRCS